MIRAGIDTSDLKPELIRQKANVLPKGYTARVISGTTGKHYNVLNAGATLGLVDVSTFTGGNKEAFINCTIVKVLGKLIVWELPE